jgi:chromosome segregation ATPase
MDEARLMIDRLRTRVAALMGVHERVKGDLAKRTAERDKLLAEREELERKVAAQEQRIRVLELAEGMESMSGGTKAARERVNKLLREVDRCLTLMNR